METAPSLSDSASTVILDHLNRSTAPVTIDHFAPRKVRLTVNLPKDLVEQMRDAVYWTPGLTLAWLIARAMRTSLAELRSARQGPFPKRSKPLRVGRPRLTGQTMSLTMAPAITVMHRALGQLMGADRARDASME